MVGVVTRSHAAKCSRCSQFRKECTCSDIIDAVKDPKQSVSYIEIRLLKKDKDQQVVKKNNGTSKNPENVKGIVKHVEVAANERVTRAKRRKISELVPSEISDKDTEKIEHEKIEMGKDQCVGGNSSSKCGYLPQGMVERRVTRASKNFLQGQVEKENAVGSFAQDGPHENSFGIGSNNHGARSKSDSENNRFSTYNYILQRKRKRMCADMYSSAFNEDCGNSGGSLKPDGHMNLKVSSKALDGYYNHTSGENCIQHDSCSNKIKENGSVLSGSGHLDAQNRRLIEMKVNNQGKINVTRPPKSNEMTKASSLQDFKELECNAKVSLKNNRKKTSNAESAIEGVRTRSQILRQKCNVAGQAHITRQGHSEDAYVSKQGICQTDITTISSVPVTVTRRTNQILKEIVDLSKGNINDVDMNMCKQHCEQKEKTYSPVFSRVTRSKLKNAETKLDTENGETRVDILQASNDDFSQKEKPLPSVRITRSMYRNAESKADTLETKMKETHTVGEKIRHINGVSRVEKEDSPAGMNIRGPQKVHSAIETSSKTADSKFNKKSFTENKNHKIRKSKIKGKIKAHVVHKKYFLRSERGNEEIEDHRNDEIDSLLHKQSSNLPEEHIGPNFPADTQTSMQSNSHPNQTRGTTLGFEPYAKVCEKERASNDAKLEQPSGLEDTQNENRVVQDNCIKKFKEMDISKCFSGDAVLDGEKHIRDTVWLTKGNSYPREFPPMANDNARNSKHGPSNMKKQCDIVSTSYKDAAGRHIRPRPLDYHQPIQVFIEGRDQGFHECEEHSLPWQQPVQKNHGNCVDNALSNISGSTSMKEKSEKQEVKLPSYRKASTYLEANHRNCGKYNLPIGYIRSSSSKVKCQNYGLEYDIDYDDKKWLLNYNNKMNGRGEGFQLSEDKFEGLMEYFEKESASIYSEHDREQIQKLSSQINQDSNEPCSGSANEKRSIPETSNSRPQLDKTNYMPSNFAVSFDCCICNGGEDSVSNPVHRCKYCGIFVHRSCYGICDDLNSSKASISSWSCRKCQVFGTAHQDVCCVICCKTGGAMKPTTHASKWAHVVCALYTDETFFLNTDCMEPIDGVSVVEARSRRQKFVCCFCGARLGSCARCSYHGCRATFHISCGVSRGAYFEMQHSNEQVIKIKSFCPRHATSLVGVNKMFEQIPNHGSQRESSFHFHEADELVSEKLTSNEMRCDTKNMVNLEAALSAHIGPVSVVSDVYGYWFNKRMKKGPLLQKLQQEESVKKYGIFNQDADAIKHYFGWKHDSLCIPENEVINRLASVRNELESVRTILRHILDRERIKSELVHLFQRIKEVELLDIQKKFALICCFVCNSSDKLLHCNKCRKLFCFQCYKKWENQTMKSYRIIQSTTCLCVDCSRVTSEKVVV